MRSLKFLPVSVGVDGRRIAIVGGGRVALHKASILRGFGCAVEVVAPQFAEGFLGTGCTLIGKSYEADDIAGAALVYACTDDGELNARIRDDCRAVGIRACVCDNPALCDFVSPAIFRERNITVAVGSDGLDARRSIRIRDRIGELIKKGILSLE
jgi:siroheme synthase-like protein